jgi:hypothetical protein
MRLSLGLSLGVSCLVLLPVLGGAACSSSNTTPNLEGADSGTEDFDTGVATNPADSGSNNNPVDSGTANNGDTGANTADTGTTNTTDAAGGDAGACMFPNGFTYGSAGCTTCLQTNCCEVVVTCVNDPACLALNNCIANCDQGTSDAGSFSPDDAGAVQTCDQACGNGVAASVINELNAQGACYNTEPDGGMGPCVAACQ